MAELTYADVLQKIAEQVSDGAAKQYDDFSKTFVTLDAKAQAAGTSGGVLLGVIVALANAGTLGSLLDLSNWCLALLVLPVGPALYAMVKALEASWIANLNIPFDFVRQAKEFSNLDTLKGELTQDDIIDFHRMRHKQWEISLKGISAKLDEKGPLVRRAQGGVLWSAIMTVAVFGLAMVVKLLGGQP